MIDFNSTLHKNEWLELVFLNRNKNYGAYELRQHNAQTTIKAMLIASVLFTSAIVSPMVYHLFFKDAVLHVPIIEGTVLVLDLPPIVKRITEPPKAATPPVKVKTIESLSMVVVPNARVTADPPTQIDLAQAVIASVTTAGTVDLGEPINLPGVESGTGFAETPKDDVNIYDSNGIEEYPEFPGGMNAFSKYLSKNLHYPALAQEREIMGRVLLSFVIEKNGDLSNIKVINGIGGGCDEEAIRVLKNSPAWKPGQQNKQKVRVAYTMPIVFQLGE